VNKEAFSPAGESADASKYRSMYEAGAKAYHEHFFNTTTKVYGVGSQCSCVMALAIGAVPKELEPTVVKTLVDSIQTVRACLPCSETHNCFKSAFKQVSFPWTRSFCQDRLGTKKRKR
jgi:hypothetical protein